MADKIADKMVSLSSENTVGDNTPMQNAVDNETAQEVSNKGLKRKLSDTESSTFMCQICQVSLNSASQALQHFKGRSHLAKVRNSHGDNSTVPVISAVAAPVVTSSTPADTFSSVSRQREQTGTTPALSASSTGTLYNLNCSVCGKSFNSQSQAKQHYVGRQHKIKAQQKADMMPVEILSQATVAPAVAATPNSSQETVPGGGIKTASNVKLGSNVKSKLFRCEACCITLNSEAQFEQHNRGLRHKMTTGQVTSPPPPEDEGWQGVRYRKLAKVVSSVFTSTGTVMVPSSTPGGTRMGQFYCERCDVSVNSQVQLQQHLSGEKHKMQVNGGDQHVPVPPQGRGGWQRRGFPPGRSRGGFRGQQAPPPGHGMPALYNNSKPPPLYTSFVSGGPSMPDVSYLS